MKQNRVWLMRCLPKTKWKPKWWEGVSESRACERGGSIGRRTWLPHWRMAENLVAVGVACCRVISKAPIEGATDS